MKTITITTSLVRNLFVKRLSSLASTTKTIPETSLFKSVQFYSPNNQFRSLNFSYLSKKSLYLFSEEKKGPLKAEDIPAENLQVVETEEKLEDEDVQVFHTKGTLSILDKVPGVKNHQSGDLYVLMFTCGQCNTKQVKSFTKNAYHKGVVLARCVGCEKVHLVADNLGWFEDQPTNVETLHKDRVKKVHDHAAINAFLKKAFEEEQTLLKHQPQQPQITEQNNTKKKE